MKLDQWITVLTSIALALLGWLIGYFTTIRRDRLLKKRDLRVQYLLEAYRRLETASNREKPTEENRAAMESAIADVQLLGSPEQVHMARQCAFEISESGGASLNRLLEELRRDLRDELSLEPLNEKMTFLRFVRDGQDSDRKLQSQKG